MARTAPAARKGAAKPAPAKGPAARKPAHRSPATKAPAAKAPAARKPASGSAKAVPACPAIRGWKDFRENGGEIIKQVAATGTEIAFSSSATVPHVRLRRASDCPAEVAALLEMWGEPEEDGLSCELVFARGKKHLLELRSLVVTGRSVLLRSGRALVLADRHPDCPRSLVDAYLAREKAHREKDLAYRTYRAAKRAASRTKRMQDGGSRIVADMRALLQEVGMDAETWGKMEKLLERVALREGVRAKVADATKPTAADLPRY